MYILRCSRCSTPLVRYGFWRIMLDEAQIVCTSNSAAAVMASQLWRRHAWVVTGAAPLHSALLSCQKICIQRWNH